MLAYEADAAWLIICRAVPIGVGAGQASPVHALIHRDDRDVFVVADYVCDKRARLAGNLVKVNALPKFSG